MWRFANPVAIHWTDDLASLLPSLLPPGQGLLITYPQFAAAARAGLLSGPLAGLPWFSGVEANPTPDQVQQAIDFARPLAPRWILAVGGGSVLDTAKIVRLALARDCPSVRELLLAIPPEAGAERPLLIAAPSTHGTGAELTQWAALWDMESNRKWLKSLSEEIGSTDAILTEMKIATLRKVKGITVD